MVRKKRILRPLRKWIIQFIRYNQRLKSDYFF